MLPPSNNSVCGNEPSLYGYCIEVGWLTDGTNWFWFWIMNTALLIPLLIAAQVVDWKNPTAFGKWFAPMWLWFVVPNVIMLQPWDWDNTKFFIFWALLGSVMVGGLLARPVQARARGAPVAVAVLLVALGACRARSTWPERPTRR